MAMSTLAPPRAAATKTTFTHKLMWSAAACVLLAIGVCMLALVTTSNEIANRDYVEYWAAGQQLVHGANPYDANRIFAIERSAGMHAPQPVVMFNPPSGLFLTLPLGTLGLKAGYLLWLVFVVSAWLGSIHLIWMMNGRPANALHFIGYFFTPALTCFFLGQMAMFVLLGLTIFLYFHRTKPLLAGAALLLCALKPHLLLPFGAALLAWMVSRKAYRVLAGAVAAFGIACLVPLFFDPSIYLQYAAMSRTSGVKAAFIPTLSELLRIFAPGAFWIVFLPAYGGCLWALWYFHRHRDEWDWRTRGPILIVVSLLVAPYAWVFDAVILLPSLLYAAYRARPTALAVLFLLLVASAAQFLLGTPAQSPRNIWPSAAWFAWYLWSMRLSAKSGQIPAGRMIGPGVSPLRESE